MADEKTTNGGEAGVEAPKKKGKLGLILIIAIVLILAGGGAYVWFFIWNAPSETAAGTNQASGEERSNTARSGSATSPEIGPLFPFRSFIVNLQEREGERYLKVTVELEMEQETLKDELTKRTPQIQDTIIALLSSKSYEEISSLSGKQVLKAEIKARVNRVLTTGSIRRVYFTEFVVQ